MGKDHAALRRRRVAEACEFLHEKLIRQTVEPIPPNALRLVAARDRQQSGDARHGAGETPCRNTPPEAGQESAMKRLDQHDLLRQMLRIEWTEPVQLLDHFRGDLLRLAIFRAAMHHAMPHRGQCVTPAVFLDPLHQSADCRRVIRRRHRPRKIVRRVRALHPQGGLRPPDPLKFAPQNPSERLTGLEQRELDARRAAIDRQDAGAG